jgi:hypothetical protein
VYYAIVVALLVLAGLMRRRSLVATGRKEPAAGLTDAHIRQIETRGSLELEDPLDLNRIKDEEARFWEESWDEPEEF